MSSGAAACLWRLRCARPRPAALTLPPALQACSAWLPLSKDFPAALGAAGKATPVQQCHGDADAVVKPEYGASSHALLKEMGLAADWTSYPGMGHEACEEELADMVGFVKRCL